MADFDHTKLLLNSNDKLLFRQELMNIVKTLDNETRFDFLTYCYKHYSDKFPDVLMEVFFPNNKPQNAESSALSKTK